MTPTRAPTRGSEEPRDFNIAGFHIPHHIGAPKWRHVFPYDHSTSGKDQRKAEVRGAVLPPPHTTRQRPWHPPPRHGTREDLKAALADFYVNEELPVDREAHWATPLGLIVDDPLSADPWYTVGAIAEAVTIIPALLWGFPKPDQDIDLYVWPEDSYGRGRNIVIPRWLSEEYPTGGAPTRRCDTGQDQLIPIFGSAGWYVVSTPAPARAQVPLLGEPWL